MMDRSSDRYAVLKREKKLEKKRFQQHHQRFAILSKYQFLLIQCINQIILHLDFNILEKVQFLLTINHL